MVKACIKRDDTGKHRIYCKRDKFKHWHELGIHRETDVEFAKALHAGTIHWETRIIDPTQIFQ